MDIKLSEIDEYARRLEKEEETDKEELANKIERMQQEWRKMNRNLAFYIEHDELEKVNINAYNVEDFNTISDSEIHRIAGTVLGINKNKHLIYLLTTDYSVVNVKFYNKNTFFHYFCYWCIFHID